MFMLFLYFSWACLTIRTQTPSNSGNQRCYYMIKYSIEILEDIQYQKINKD